MGNEDDDYSTCVLIVPSVGRYIWWPALQIVDFKTTGRTRPATTLPLRESTRASATRIAALHAADVVKETPQEE